MSKAINNLLNGSKGLLEKYGYVEEERPVVKKRVNEGLNLTDDELDAIDEIAERFNVSYVNGESYIAGYGPVSTEDNTTLIERDMIADELGYTEEEANEIMVHYLGFSAHELDESLNEPGPSRQGCRTKSCR